MGRKNLNNETVQLADAATAPTAAGEIQRNGALAFFHDGTHARRLVTDGTLWVPAMAMGLKGTAAEMYYGNFDTVDVDAGLEGVTWNFIIPPDFLSLVEAKLLYIAVGGWANSDGWDIASDYAKYDGSEAYNIHSESAANQDNGAKTADRIYTLSLSGILSSLAAEDVVGLSAIANNDGVNGAVDARVLGAILRYKR